MAASEIPIYMGVPLPPSRGGRPPRGKGPLREALEKMAVGASIFLPAPAIVDVNRITQCITRARYRTPWDFDVRWLRDHELDGVVHPLVIGVWRVS